MIYKDRINEKKERETSIYFSSLEVFDEELGNYLKNGKIQVKTKIYFDSGIKKRGRPKKALEGYGDTKKIDF